MITRPMDPIKNQKSKSKSKSVPECIQFHGINRPTKNETTSITAMAIQNSFLKKSKTVKRPEAKLNLKAYTEYY